MTIDTLYNIGDAVWQANAYGIEKDIIRAIKIEGRKNKIQYGFKSRGGGYSIFFSDDYAWFDAKDVFDTEEYAQERADSLIRVRKAKEQTEKAESLAKRKAKVEEELRLLEKGVDPDDIEDDD